MALTLAQKNWLNRSTADKIYEKVAGNSIPMELLEEYARENSGFQAKLDAVKMMEASLPNPQEVMEFEHLKALFTTAPTDSATTEALNAYLRTWQGTLSAEQHINEIKDMAATAQRMTRFSRLSTQAEEAIQKYETARTLPSAELMRSIDSFITEWEGNAAAAAQVAACRQWQQKFFGLMEELVTANWPKVVGPHGKIFNFASMRDFLETYPVSKERREQADDLMWQWVLEQEDPFAASAQYAAYWGNSGRHSAEVASQNKEQALWENYLSTASFEELNNYLKSNKNSSIASMVRGRINSLKQEKLDEIRRRPNAFSYPEFMEMYNGEVFSREELMEAAGADEEMLERLLNLRNIRSVLEEMPENIGTGTGERGVTDVILFGITSTGKSCVLAGLINHDSMGYDSVRFSGKYAQIVHSYAQQGIPPAPTNLGQVATIKAHYIDPANRNRYNFNLFEMAGEDFRSKIANAVDDNGEAQTTFEDMGAGAPTILMSENDKLFLVLIDPTVNPREKVLQQQAVQALINIMFGGKDGVNENADIMSRVVGLHFIVTKADTMGAEGEELKRKACDFVKSHVNTALRNTIVEGCRRYGINASDNPQLNGVPRVFPFSLGQFTVGNIFKYNPVPAGNLLQVISDYSVCQRPAGIIHKLRDILITPRF